jgi:hypothetical protein
MELTEKLTKIRNFLEKYKSTLSYEKLRQKVIDKGF